MEIEIYSALIGAIQASTGDAAGKIGDISRVMHRLNGISASIAAAVEQQVPPRGPCMAAF